MGWVCRCFGNWNRKRGKNHLPNSIPATSEVKQDRSVQRKKLGSFLLIKEENDIQPSLDDTNRESLCTELKREAKYLKSSGALLQTPAETQKALSKGSIQSSVENDVSSNPQSQLPHSSSEKLSCDEQHGEQSTTPVQLQQNSRMTENNSERGGFEGHQITKSYESIPTTFKMVKIKSFEGTDSESAVGPMVYHEDLDKASQNEFFSQYYPNCSPFPTPLKVTDDMQTPATVYPTNLENAKTRKDTRIRMEYISDSSDTILESSANLQVETGFSQLLDPPSLDNKGANKAFSKKEKSHSGKSSDVDRPIIGMVAAHWNDGEPEPRPVKCWDGNGIPNSTDKYKEDQKVSWHATPFEERLEKALSSESPLPQRMCFNGKPMHFQDEELIDTAAS